MTCIKHNFRLVNNHYNDKGEIDIESFSTGEWRTEKVCTGCDYIFKDNLNLLGV